MFAFQDATADGTVRSLTGRAFIFAVYQPGRVEVAYFPGEIKSDDTGQYVLWALDGSTSESLYAQPGLRWELSERKDNGRDRIATGTLSIDESAPRVDDFDGVPIASYISRIVRKNDPQTIDQPVFSVRIAAYPGVAPAGVSSMDLSQLTNSNYLAVLAA